MNVVVISGRLTKNPELRTTTTTSVCQCKLAVDNGKTDGNGKRGADFIDCICFGKVAENLVKYQSKGSMIELTGHIQNNKYTDKDGKNVYRTIINVDMVNYISSPKNNVKRAKNDEKDAYQEMSNRINSENDLPF